VSCTSRSTTARRSTSTRSLVPSAIDGYKVYNTFENTGRADDIGPNYTAVNLFAPDSNGIDGPDAIDKYNVIVCVSDHGAAQNEPYQQEAGGLVSAKNRPIVAPKVTALGVSAVGPLNTFKIGFGYDIVKWYTAPSFDGAGVFPTVTDPNASGGGALPAFVRMDPRPADFGYDARRVTTSMRSAIRGRAAASRPSTARTACSAPAAMPPVGRCRTTTSPTRSVT
jgi:hypothetical protein